MLGYQKGKNGCETTEKRQRILVKRLVKKENFIFPWLGRVSKTGRILSENRRWEIFAEKGRFQAKTGALESLYSI